MSTHAVFIVGRGLIAVSFLVSAIGKANNWKVTIGLMHTHHMPFPTLGLAGAVAIEILGGACLVMGMFLYPTVIALVAYVALATAFIPLQDVLRNRGRESATPVIGSNIAIIGGLILVLVFKWL